MVGTLDYGVSYHVIATELAIGMAMVTIVAIIVRLLSRSERMQSVADATAYFAGGFALLSLLFAAFTGFAMTWGMQAVTWVMLTKNKMMFASFAIIAWALFFVLHHRYGSELWQDKPLTASYVLLALLGALNVTILGSLGAKAALLKTVIQGFWDAVGVDPVHTIALSPVVSYAIILLTIAAVAIAAVARQQRRVRAGLF